MHRCADRGTCRLSFLGISPSSRLFEVASRPPMPPKVAASRRGRGSSVTVGLTHPADVAAAKKQADVASRAVAAPTRASRAVALPTRESPKRGAKNVANDRIAAQMSPHERVPVAMVAPPGAEIDATVIAPCAGSDDSSTPLPPKNLSIPPLWNAWYSSCCQVLCYVNDGGALVGRCALCGNVQPGRKDVMLDPEQLEELRANPHLTYDPLTGSVKVSHAISRVSAPASYPRGQVRRSPQKFTARSESSEDSDSSYYSPPSVFGTKTTGLSEEEVLSPYKSPLFSSDVNRDAATPTNNEVSRYSFFDRLKHYMEGNLITEGNRASVEMCILVEAGSAVRGMDPMKKEKKEQVYFAKYLAILDEIEDSTFSNDHIRHSMRLRYKNAKKDNTGTSLWRKYEAELRELRNFSKKIPGVGSLSELPSGSNQLKHMKMPLVEALWREKHPVMSCVFFMSLCLIFNLTSPLIFVERRGCRL